MSLLTAFLAENPFVHVRRYPLSSAVCSTGNENVKPRGTVRESTSRSPVSCKSSSNSVVDVRNASTESAR
jgi:hypothetical protein